MNKGGQPLRKDSENAGRTQSDENLQLSRLEILGDRLEITGEALSVTGIVQFRKTNL